MLIIWILTGAVAGWLASLIVGNEDSGCATNIVIGMIGSLIGGSLEAFLRTGRLDLNLDFINFGLTSILVSTIGAVLLLGLLNLFKK